MTEQAKKKLNYENLVWDIWLNFKSWARYTKLKKIALANEYKGRTSELLSIYLLLDYPLTNDDCDYISIVYQSVMNGKIPTKIIEMFDFRKEN